MLKLKFLTGAIALIAAFLFVSGCSDNPVTNSGRKTVSLFTPETSFYEGNSDTIEYKIMLSEPLASDSLAVEFELTTDAFVGEDYDIIITPYLAKTPPNGENTDKLFYRTVFNAGDYIRTVRIIIHDNNTFKETLNFDFILHSVTSLAVNKKANDEYTLGLNISAECIVLDNDGPKMTDFDGNVYHTLKIGNQIWTVENLKTTHFMNGDQVNMISEDAEWWGSAAPAYCNYNNIAIVDRIGRLYNWYAANDSRKLLPDGWHIPTENDWQQMIAYLGSNGFYPVGNKLKEAGSENWYSDNAFGNSADNETGFTALPGGYRKQSFNMANKVGGFWSSTAVGNNQAYSYSMSYNTNDVKKAGDFKQTGWSIRAVKDITD